MRVCAVVCEHRKSPAACGTRVQLFGFSTSVCQFRVKSSQSPPREIGLGVSKWKTLLCVFSFSNKLVYAALCKRSKLVAISWCQLD